MTADLLLSPLDHLTAEFERASGDRVHLREAPFLSQLSLRLAPDGAACAAVGAALGVPLPLEPNTVAWADELQVLWLRPDEWLVVGAPGEQDHLEKLLRVAIGTEFGSVVDTSAQRTTLLLRGSQAADVLAAGCALDLDPAVFTDPHCAQTWLAKAPVLLSRLPDGFRLAVRSSFADYLARWLLDAITEYRSDTERGGAA